MPTEKSISFRDQLVSNTMNLIKEVNVKCTDTTELIAGIVSQLAAYTEEGIPMSPSVFICNSISELVQRAGTAEFIQLGGDVPTESSGSKILKAAAPLCRENWNIYIERSGNGQTCAFGVFCGSNDPTSLTVDEVLLNDFSDGFPVIKVSQSSTNKVEVRTNAGGVIEFRFNNDIDVNELNSQARIKNLAQAISSGIKSTDHRDESFTEFVERILSSAINNSHGTLIAVIDSADTTLHQSLSDAVLLKKKVDLYERYIRHFSEGKTAATVSVLQSAAELISGFICSDGITVFDTSGSAIAFRSFVRSEEQLDEATGGARTRAYQSMCKLVNESVLHAAFFRSQDGRIEFHKRAN